MTGQPIQHLETQPGANVDVSGGPDQASTSSTPPSTSKTDFRNFQGSSPINCIKDGIPGPETDSGAPGQPGQAKLTDNILGIKEGDTMGIPQAPPHF